MTRWWRHYHTDDVISCQIEEFPSWTLHWTSVWSDGRWCHRLWRFMTSLKEKKLSWIFMNREKKIPVRDPIQEYSWILSIELENEFLKFNSIKCHLLWRHNFPRSSCGWLAMNWHENTILKYLLTIWNKTMDEVHISSKITSNDLFQNL